MSEIDNVAVAAHYTPADLVAALTAGITALGKTTDTVSFEDFAPVEEFHIGGRQATRALLDQLDFSADDRVLDIGCGLGGTARFIAATYGSQVTGIDLTSALVDAGNEISEWVSLSDAVKLQQGNALQTEFEAGSFDAATMLHVGMNIADKAGLFGEVARVLRTGGTIAVYDVMRNADAPLSYPVPWAMDDETCAIAPLAEYQKSLRAAGFEIVSTRDRTGFANAFFAQLQKNAAAADGPPPLGLHLMMGRTTPEKVKNMVTNLTTGRIAPVEVIARKT